MAAVIAFLLLAVAAAYADDIQTKTHYRNCYELRQVPDSSDGVYVIYPYEDSPDLEVPVWCDMTTEGGGWTVFQRRGDFSDQEKFERTWDEYSRGFGNLKQDHWLGLDHIHALTDQRPNILRIYLADFEGEERFAQYEVFHVADRAASYQLEVNSYDGTAGDSFSRSNGMMFTTRDKDLDTCSCNCATDRRGAWWYDNCGRANLNGLYLRGDLTVHGVYWYDWRQWNYSLKDTVMMIRPR